MDHNFKSQLHMIRACLPPMKARHYGRIANASSISGRLPTSASSPTPRARRPSTC
jgi:NADP-dependent 3-hydroxy acid dehydrogenase YdfG